MNSQPTILIVEDDPGIADALKQLLEMSGYSAVIASNGREALSLLERHVVDPQLILLDLMMPVLDGWGFMEARRKIPALQAIPVVIISAVADRAFPEGAVAIHRKPLEIDALLSSIAMHL